MKVVKRFLRSWRLEPQGETEVLESIVVSDAVESRRDQVEAKFSRREREAPGPGEEEEEIKSPKRKVIRMESEETQDYVRKAKSAEQEEVEERTLKPSAVGVPHKMLFRCDKQCSEKSRSYWQLASVVVHEGVEAYTTNLCQKCLNNNLQAKGERPLSNVQRRQVVGKNSYRSWNHKPENAWSR